jgi:hypothetical protein
MMPIVHKIGIPNTKTQDQQNDPRNDRGRFLSDRTNRAALAAVGPRPRGVPAIHVHLGSIIGNDDPRIQMM